MSTKALVKIIDDAVELKDFSSLSEAMRKYEHLFLIDAPKLVVPKVKGKPYRLEFYAIPEFFVDIIHDFEEQIEILESKMGRQCSDLDIENLAKAVEGASEHNYPYIARALTEGVVSNEYKLILLCDNAEEVSELGFDVGIEEAA